MTSTLKNLTTFRTPLLACTVLIFSGCLSQEKSFTEVPDDYNGTGADSSSPASPSNSSPSIWGAPANAVMTGDNYSFTPSADDPDGDKLTFSIKGKPRWADFNSSTGRLSGQPVLGDEGIYDQIVITVSDGTSSDSLRAFSVEVTQSALGSMTLSWTAPTENEDGSALTDLAGYNLYYGEKEGSYDKRIRIDNPGVTMYVIDNLLPRTYYVVATAFNAKGVESAYSGVAVKLVEEQS